MITAEQIISVGLFVKPHGVKGVMAATLTVDGIEDFSTVICSMDGIFVPFFLTSVRSKSAYSQLLTIDGVDSDVKAKVFTNKKIYVLRSEFDEATDEVYCDYFIGFTILDTKGNEIGRITDLDDSTENVLFEVDCDGVQFYIPVSEDFIVSIDEPAKTMTMDLPEGLITSQTE